MYHPIQVASFSMMHFELFLEGLTDEQARERVLKADGSRMNAISWLTGHVASQWLFVAAGAARETSAELGDLRARAHPFRTGSEDPTPPPLREAIDLLHGARKLSRWIVEADDALMGSLGREEFLFRSNPEILGTRVMRASVHTLIHAGEVVAIRQVLGLPEVGFVQNMPGNLQWMPEGATVPEWVDYPPPKYAYPQPTRG